MDNEKNIAEINEVIAKVEAALEPGCEIGARDKSTLRGLLRVHNIDGNIKFFPCKRENSARIVAHFVRTRGIPQSRFSINAQPEIFILCGGPAKENDRTEASAGREVKTEKEEKVVKPQQPPTHRKEEKPAKEKKAQKEKPAKKTKSAKKDASRTPAKKAKAAKKKK